MNTNLLKRFATEARTNLMDGVRLKLRMLGFDERGHAAKAPELISGGTIWRGEEYPEEFYAQWMALRELLLKRGVREVVETAAYTWFNRMVAIRILTRNNLCDSILDNDPMTGMPRLLAEARMGRVAEMTDQQRRRYEWLMDDDMRTTDQFAVLLTAWCHANPIINSCFGSIDGFVEILLPDNILKDGGFLSLLNHTEFITDEDFHSAELIGWLYQFYISDRKDEVFAKKGKVEADEIPAATQIFTPNWIVKYMVQNTIGAIALSNKEEGRSNIGEAAKEMGWEYFVTSNKEEGKSNGGDGSDITYSLSPITCHFESLEALKVADFACGSGHILNECFDLLYDLYMAEAYSRREAIECIFTKNLLGIDIDLRAKQLATFALLLKACQKDSAFADAHCMPRVLTVPEFTAILKTSKYEDEDGGHGKHIKHVFFQDSVTDAVANELEDAFTLLRDADSLGSIIKFNLSASALRAIKDTSEYWQSKDAATRPEFVNDLLPAIDFIMALTDSYDSIVMNPPYMGGGKMDAVLSKYVKDNYKDGSADLATVFVEMAPQHLNEGGEYAFIIPPSWMFLSGFEALRRHIIANYSIQSLLHLSRGVFGADFGASCAVIKNSKNGDFKGTYFRLIERTFQEFDQRHLKELFEKVLENHEFKFLFKDYTKDVASIEYSEQGAKIYYTGIDQKQFEQIPGAPLGYWIPNNTIKSFKYNNFISEFFSGHGLLSGHDEDMLRYWHEVDFTKIGFNHNSDKDFWESTDVYVPLAKGGDYRKWYGNLYSVVKYTKDTIEHMKQYPKFTLQNSNRYFKSGVTWSDITSAQKLGGRVIPSGMIFSHRSPTAFVENDYPLSALNSFLISKVTSYYIALLNPTISISAGVINKLPIISKEKWINNLADDCITISKQDWDAHENSWDFGINELVGLSKKANTINNISEFVELYKEKWEKLFQQLHANEEELNRQFIEIYGLQDELTPDVPLKDVTILQQGEINVLDYEIIVDDNEEPLLVDYDGSIIVSTCEPYIEWNEDVIIKQLISYIVGVWMGRYRLDKPGLHIAHPNPTEEELAEYTFSITSNQTLKIDSDAIIPILPKDAPFFDNLYNYVVEFVRKVWGDESLAENINFIEKCLGKSLEDYLMKDFWKYHKKMYQNRPIYWEFASKKGAFRAIVYAHRMDRFTVEVLRSKYLLPYIGHIERKIAALEIRQNELTTAERRELDTLRTKTLPELEEYHKRVEKVAAETAARSTVFDLDDGIIRNHALFGDIVTKLK